MKMKKAGIVLILILCFPPLSSYAENLKKVLILDFVNVEKRKDFQYLELSITDAVAAMLSEKFVFKKMPRRTALEIADANYLYREDFFTKSVAVNLGLLGSQDVVISGGFRITERKRNIVITTEIRIFDISEKSMIREFSVSGPADDRIWDTVNDIANKISKEAAGILPTKDEWTKKGYADYSESEPVFASPEIGMRGGGFFYSGGWADYFTPQQPVVGIVFSWSVPLVSQNFITQAEFYFMTHSLKEGGETYVQREHMSGTTSNYFFGLFPMYKFAVFDKLNVLPKAGAGWVLQVTSVTGEYSSNFSNGFPFAGTGFDFMYEINNFMSVVLSGQSMVEIEEGTYTYVNMINLGMNFKL